MCFCVDTPEVPPVKTWDNHKQSMNLQRMPRWCVVNQRRQITINSYKVDPYQLEVRRATTPGYFMRVVLFGNPERHKHEKKHMPFISQ